MPRDLDIWAAILIIPPLMILVTMLLVGWIFNLPAWWLWVCIGAGIGEFIGVIALLWAKPFRTQAYKE